MLIVVVQCVVICRECRSRVGNWSQKQKVDDKVQNKDKERIQEETEKPVAKLKPKLEKKWEKMNT